MNDILTVTGNASSLPPFTIPNVLLLTAKEYEKELGVEGMLDAIANDIRYAEEAWNTVVGKNQSEYLLQMSLMTDNEVEDDMDKIITSLMEQLKPSFVDDEDLPFIQHSIRSLSSSSSSNDNRVELKLKRDAFIDWYVRWLNTVPVSDDSQVLDCSGEQEEEEEGKRENDDRMDDARLDIVLRSPTIGCIAHTPSKDTVADGTISIFSANSTPIVNRNNTMTSTSTSTSTLDVVEINSGVPIKEISSSYGDFGTEGSPTTVTALPLSTVTDIMTGFHKTVEVEGKHTTPTANLERGEDESLPVVLFHIGSHSSATTAGSSKSCFGKKSRKEEVVPLSKQSSSLSCSASSQPPPFAFKSTNIAGSASSVPLTTAIWTTSTPSFTASKFKDFSQKMDKLMQSLQSLQMDAHTLQQHCLLTLQDTIQSKDEVISSLNDEVKRLQEALTQARLQAEEQAKAHQEANTKAKKIYEPEREQFTSISDCDEALAALYKAKTELAAWKEEFEASSRLCVLCHTKRKVMAVIPCGHLCLCEEDGKKLMMKKDKNVSLCYCPVCHVEATHCLKIC